MNILINILLVVYVIVALLMVLVILMQRPKSEGLGAAFGGGVTENIFGAQTTNVLVKFTGWLAGIFFVLTFGLSILYAHRASNQSALRSELMKNQPPASANGSPAPNASPAAAGSGVPSPQPSASAVVGPPGTVTNPTPAAAGPSASIRPADMAVGAAPVATQAPQTSQAPPPPPPQQSAAPRKNKKP
jgi:preprotein translocase subunit SecG